MPGFHRSNSYLSPASCSIRVGILTCWSLFAFPIANTSSLMTRSLPKAAKKAFHNFLVLLQVSAIILSRVIVISVDHDCQLNWSCNYFYILCSIAFPHLIFTFLSSSILNIYQTAIITVFLFGLQCFRRVPFQYFYLQSFSHMCFSHLSLSIFHQTR